MRRIVTLVVSLVMAVALFGATAFAGGNPNEWPFPGFQHGHAMLIGVEVEFTTEGVVAHYKKCVDFKPLPVMAHHHSIHTGNAGVALFEKAGNVVLPLDPLTPFDTCDDIPNPLPVPEED